MATTREDLGVGIQRMLKAEIERAQAAVLATAQEIAEAKERRRDLLEKIDAHRRELERQKSLPFVGQEGVERCGS